ncbi:MAG: hypothetical protein M0009_00075 [Deltaproteobacteria bacterium]|nr:hypothetical protein [Deltaproteobacteria bacterium]
MIILVVGGVTGCATPGGQLAIINPQEIDQKEAKEQVIARYVDLMAKTDGMGLLEYATSLCRRIKAGQGTPDIVKSSPNGRYNVYLFKEKEGDGSEKGDYAVIAFHFDPQSELMRICNSEGKCNVFVRNGAVRFGRTNILAQGEPLATDSGISIKYVDDRSYAFDLLFSYLKNNQQEGDRLIALFTSAFPFLFYQ